MSNEGVAFAEAGEKGVVVADVDGGVVVEIEPSLESCIAGRLAKRAQEGVVIANVDDPVAIVVAKEAEKGLRVVGRRRDGRERRGMHLGMVQSDVVYAVSNGSPGDAGAAERDGPDQAAVSGGVRDRG